jgi:hypothetical protein
MYIMRVEDVLSHGWEHYAARQKLQFVRLPQKARHATCFEAWLQGINWRNIGVCEETIHLSYYAATISTTEKPIAEEKTAIAV